MVGGYLARRGGPARAVATRKVLGSNLEECSIEELQSLEDKAEKGLLSIRTMKVSQF